MKTKLYLLIATLFLGNALLAQVNFGIKAGANLTKIEGKSFKEEFSTGYHLGAFASLGLGGKLSIQPEVLFNQVNTRVDTSFKNVYQNALSGAKDIKLNYLSIPLVLNYKMGALSLQAGPQFGILLDQNKNLVENGREAFRKGDLSMLGGAQIAISKLRFTGRYVVGLTNINDIDDQNKWKNQGFQLSVGLAL